MPAYVSRVGVVGARRSASDGTGDGPGQVKCSMPGVDASGGADEPGTLPRADGTSTPGTRQLVGHGGAPPSVAIRHMRGRTALAPSPVTPPGA